MTAKGKIGGAAAASLAAIICGTVGANYGGTGGSDSVSVTYEQLVNSGSAQTEQTPLSEGTVEVTLYSSTVTSTTRPPLTASTAVTTISATTVSSVATSASAVVTTVSEPVTIEEEIVITVYVSNSGKYHSKSNCSGMKHYTEMSLDEAIGAGHVACKKCW